MSQLIEVPGGAAIEVPTGLAIDTWRAATGGGTIAVSDPATGEQIGTIADATPADAVAALDVAHAAGPAWAARPARERSEILRRAFDLLIEREETFARLISREMGKTVAEARAEVRYGAEYVRWYAEEAVRLSGRNLLSPDGRSQISTIYGPVGTCLLITPWNFPLAMATRKIAPALAAGCGAVLKPATETPLTSLLFVDLLHEAGVPAGLVSVVTTGDPRGTFEPLLDDPRVRKLSFTGSTAIGAHLAARGAKQLLRTSMELGGNAPFLVFDDADLDVAVAGAMVAKLRNNGQSCIAANRFLVQDGIADAFVERFSAAIAAARVGDPFAGDTAVGPLIDARAVTSNVELVDDAVARGATLVAGGSAIDGPGNFMAPTVLDRVPADARLLHEEIFGPVAPIVRFSAEDEALTQANATEYGLVAYCFTQDVNRMARVEERLDVGMIGVNQGLVSNVAAPFGGVKHSGLGREGGVEGLIEYMALKYTARARPV